MRPAGPPSPLGPNSWSDAAQGNVSGEGRVCCDACSDVGPMSRSVPTSAPWHRAQMHKRTNAQAHNKGCSCTNAWHEACRMRSDAWSHPRAGIRAGMRAWFAGMSACVRVPWGPTCRWPGMPWPPMLDRAVGATQAVQGFSFGPFVLSGTHARAERVTSQCPRPGHGRCPGPLESAAQGGSRWRDANAQRDSQCNLQGARRWH